MNVQDEARAIRKLNRRLVRLHRDAWERWQAASRLVRFPREYRGPRKLRPVGPLRVATVRGARL
jgi:hypothetical protein